MKTNPKSTLYHLMTWVMMSICPLQVWANDEKVSLTLSDGTTTQYATLAEAWGIATAQTGAATIRLLADVETGILGDEQIAAESAGPQITLDLNDKKLKGTDEHIIKLNKPNTLTIVDNAETKTTRYFTVDGTTCALTDSQTSNAITGGVITGTSASAIYYDAAGTLLEVRDINFLGCGATDHFGGAINIHAPANIYRCKFYGNKGKVGGAISVENSAIVKDCDFKYNYGSGYGGAIWCNSVLTIINTTIQNNQAGTAGNGVYLGNSSCLAAGTMITMADGSQKKIEEVVEGDMIRTFDHESGTLTASPVFLAMRGLAPVHSYTLTFESGNQLEVIGRHAFLCQSTSKYEALSDASAASYIGQSFYNADHGQWDRLVDVTSNHTPAYYYSLTTAHQIDYVANGMLNVGADYSFLLNLYELDSDLKADAAQLAEDIATYGLDDIANYPMLTGLEPLFDALNAKYLKIAVGKGLVSSQFIANMIASVDFGNQGNASHRASGRRNATSVATEAEQEPTFATYTSGVDANICLVVGHDVVITDNVYGSSTNNLFLEDAEKSSSGAMTKAPTVCLIADDHAGSSIGVSVPTIPRIITEGTVTSSDLSLFTSDSGQIVTIKDSQICIFRKTPGDVYVDGRISIADLSQTVAIVRGDATDTYGTADVDGSGAVDGDDVKALRDKILNVSETASGQ